MAKPRRAKQSPPDPAPDVPTLGKVVLPSAGKTVFQLVIATLLSLVLVGRVIRYQ